MIFSLNYLLRPNAMSIAQVVTKDQAMGLLAALFANVYDLDCAAVEEALREREMLGSTGFGHGAALPHARIHGLKRPVAALIKLNTPIDFAAVDDLAVDLVFGLLSPYDCGVTHLHALAEISRLIRNGDLQDRLAKCDSTETMQALLTEATNRDAA